MNENLTKRQIRDRWMQKITSAEKKFADYNKLVDEIRQYYRNERQKNNRLQ